MHKATGAMLRCHVYRLIDPIGPCLNGDDDMPGFQFIDMSLQHAILHIAKEEVVDAFEKRDSLFSTDCLNFIEAGFRQRLNQPIKVVPRVDNAQDLSGRNGQRLSLVANPIDAYGDLLESRNRVTLERAGPCGQAFQPRSCPWGKSGIPRSLATDYPRRLPAASTVSVAGTIRARS